jgi:hypothetical protein
MKKLLFFIAVFIVFTAMAQEEPLYQYPNKGKYVKNKNTTRCFYITKEKVRCPRMTRNAIGKCDTHNK